MLGQPRNFVVEFFRDRRLSNRLADGLVLDRFHLAAVSANLAPLDDRELGTLLHPEPGSHRFGFEFDDRQSIAAAQPLHVGDAVGQLFDREPGAERSVDERVGFGRHRVDQVRNVLQYPRCLGLADRGPSPTPLREFGR